MLNLCAVFAQLERETIQKRVSDAYRSRSQKGFYMGGRVPFGFRVEQIKMDGISTSRYQPVKEEIRWVKEMFSFYAQQEASLGELAQYLKELGAVNRQGKAFCPARLGSSFGIRFTSRRTGRFINFFAIGAFAFWIRLDGIQEKEDAICTKRKRALKRL